MTPNDNSSILRQTFNNNNVLHNITNNKECKYI